MVKATLRTSSPKPPTITSAPAGVPVVVDDIPIVCEGVQVDSRATAGVSVVVDNNPIVCEGVQVDSRATACPAGGLESMLPDAPLPDHPAPPAACAVAIRPRGAWEQVSATLESMLPDAPLPDHPAPPAACAVATRPSMVVGRTSQYGGEGLDGEWGADDLKFPQLKQVQGSGPLSTQFDNGTIIYGDTELLPAPSVKEGAKNPLIRFFPVSLTKQYREKLSQDAVEAGEMPRIANTVAEVEDMGGTTRWLGKSMPDNYWEPSARCIFLLELPEGSEHPGFALSLDGKQYAVAVYYAAGGAFRASAKIIFNTALTSLLVPVIGEDGQPKRTPSGQVVKKPMLWKNVWTLAFAKVQAGSFTPWRPIVKLLPKEESGPEVRAYCENLVAGDAANGE